MAAITMTHRERKSTLNFIKSFYQIELGNTTNYYNFDTAVQKRQIKINDTSLHILNICDLANKSYGVIPSKGTSIKLSELNDETLTNLKNFIIDYMYNVKEYKRKKQEIEDSIKQQLIDLREYYGLYVSPHF